MKTAGSLGRLCPWVALSSIALLLSITPAALLPDLEAPLHKWETWYRPLEPEAQPQFSLENLPPAFKRELMLFQVLVIPPGYLAKAVNGLGTEYSLPWVNPGSSTEMRVYLPPLARLLQHLRYAIPLWLVLFVGSYEAVTLVRRRRGRVA